MSIFGFMSLFVVVASVAVLVLHYRLMRRRAPVDVHFAHLEEQLRQWTENLYSISPAGSDLRILCDRCIDMDFAGLLLTAPEIYEAFNQASEAGILRVYHLSKYEYEEGEEEVELSEYKSATAAPNPHLEQSGPDKHIAAMHETIEVLNRAVKEYNTFIAKNPTVALMAHVLSLETVEPIQEIFTQYARYEQDAIYEQNENDEQDENNENK